MQSINLAINTGRIYQKEQTGYIHFCYQSGDRVTHDTIPLLENAHFALALFRSRLSDPVLEGKGIIEKLLAFEVEGNFPVYLHQFPKLEDPYMGIRLLPVLFWIHHDFSHVIGSLKKEIEGCMGRIIATAERLTLPKWAERHLLALQGKSFSVPDSLHEWGEGLISAQIAEKKGVNMDEIIQKALTLWHPDLFIYLGKTTKRNQEECEEELTLFDLFLSSWQKKFSAKALKSHIEHLRGALIRPLGYELHFEPKSIPFIDFNEEGEAPLFIAWGGESITHTFMLAKKQLQVKGDASHLFLTYPLEIPENDEKGLEVNFFLNHHPDHDLFINGKKGNVFQVGDSVEIRSKGVTLKLIFTAEKGKFLGHILRGNRPSQHACKGQNKYEAYDWRIALRTVDRDPNCVIQVQVLSEQTQESQLPLPSHASHYPHIESHL